MTQGADYPGYPEPEPEPEPEEAEPNPESEDPEEPDEAPPANGDVSDDEPTEPEPEPEPEEAEESDQPAEPENESRSKLELAEIIVSKVFIPQLSTTEVVISGAAGALIAINFSQALEGISPDGFIYLAFIFALMVLPIRFLEESMSAPREGTDVKQDDE